MRESRDQQPSPGQQRTDKAFHHDNEQAREGLPGDLIWKWQNSQRSWLYLKCSSALLKKSPLLASDVSFSLPVLQDIMLVGMKPQEKHFHQPLISIVKLMGKPSASADVAVNLLCVSLTATRNPMFLLWPCHNIVLSAPIEGSNSDAEA